MSVQAVNSTVLNGRLGVKAPGGVECMAVVGPCSGGSVATPSRHVRVEDLLATYLSGAGAELGISAIARWKGDVLMCRATASTASSFGAIDVTGVTGACVVTKNAGATSDDDYEAGFVVVKGGTVGVQGITYRNTLDNFRTLGPETALGTATTITIPNSGGIAFDLTAATLNAKDKVSMLAHGPTSSTSDLSTALAALVPSQQPWKAVWIAQPVDATYLAVVQTFLNNVESITGKDRKAYCTFRFPTPGESEAAYLAAFTTARAAFGADKRITLCAAAVRQVSARPGRAFQFRRPTIFAIAGLPAALPLGVDMSQRVDATPDGLPGASIYDANGNQVEHDEMINPGLSDAGALVLRSWPDKAGVFVNDPVTLEQVGGDFHLDQMVRILCAFCDAAKGALADELSRAQPLNRKTNGANVAGAMTEDACQKIDARVSAAIAAAIKTEVTSFEFKVNRDDLILSSQTINAAGGILFKGYPKAINFTVAAINPAAS